MFIELTNLQGGEHVTVNLLSITAYYPLDDGGTRLIFNDRHHLDVKESYLKVKQIEEREVQAERGY